MAILRQELLALRTNTAPEIMIQEQEKKLEKLRTYIAYLENQ